MMKRFFSIALLLLSVPFCLTAQSPCEDCADRDSLLPAAIQTEAPCFELRLQCAASLCPEGILPYSCLSGTELCVGWRIKPEWGCANNASTLWPWLQQQSVSVQVGGSTVQSFPLSAGPGIVPMAGEWRQFCFDAESLFGPAQPGQVLQPSNLPEVVLRLAAFQQPAQLRLLPEGALLIGDTLQAGLSGFAETPRLTKHCSGAGESLAAGSFFKIRPDGRWSFEGEQAGAELQDAGQFDKHWRTQQEFLFAEAAPLPEISSADCTGLSADCPCCNEVSARFAYSYNVYEELRYGCDGQLLPGSSTLAVVETTQAPVFTKKPIECPGPFNLSLEQSLQVNTGQITVEQELDFDFYELDWAGPNGFSAQNSLALQGLTVGTYCYTLTHCDCGEILDQGCVAVCGDAEESGPWYYDDATGLYCRAVLCPQSNGPAANCLDAVPCSEWSYDVYEGRCFQEVCYEGEALYVDGVVPSEVAYTYVNGNCRAEVMCLDNGETVTVEHEPSFSEPYFDEQAGACFRYVICNGLEVEEEEVAIQHIEWEYNDWEGCVGRVSCDFGSFNDGTVEGWDVETQYANWEYEDFWEVCVKDVTCSYNFGFTETLYRVVEIEAAFQWSYNDSWDECIGQVICDGEYNWEQVSENPSFSNWDYSAAWNLDCERVAVCGNGFGNSAAFTDTGNSNIYEVEGDCNPSTGEKPCYTIVECNGQVVIDQNDGNGTYTVPCESPCYGFKGAGQEENARLSASGLSACGVQLLQQPDMEGGLLRIKESALPTISHLSVVEVGSGRVAGQFSVRSTTQRLEGLMQQPSGLYAVVVYFRDGTICSGKFMAW